MEVGWTARDGPAAVGLAEIEQAAMEQCMDFHNSTTSPLHSRTRRERPGAAAAAAAAAAASAGLCIIPMYHLPLTILESSMSDVEPSQNLTAAAEVEKSHALSYTGLQHRRSSCSSLVRHNSIMNTNTTANTTHMEHPLPHASIGSLHQRLPSCQSLMQHLRTLSTGSYASVHHKHNYNYLDRAKFPRGRSTGVDYGFDPTLAASGGGAAAPYGNVVYFSLPVGEAFFSVLQRAWNPQLTIAPAAATGPSPLVPRARRPSPREAGGPSPLNVRALVECTVSEPLAPPVPLLHMVDLLAPQWEAEGLYEAARREEHAAEQQKQMMQR
ncbi:hypothetical protein STCU_10112 [Strigomonas culicis]|uniref:Uncharacterized protein n=1 Tax=Strigomonas culicis TaxID=28005 RepID=S9TNB6_9TRYP|nr:hypothetical protein STCU_10112 [Strigomonas culicis]|eukprot:EPY18224.1 hypothetical protein STCU_10112 [Strigomonas culicis]